MCLTCGFDGRAMQIGRSEPSWLCPRCSADLYARPPRSYAELEGLDRDDDAGDEAAAPRAGAVGATLGFRATGYGKAPVRGSGSRPVRMAAPGRNGLLGHLKPIGVLLGAIIVVAMAATLIGIGVWLPVQF